VRLVARSLPLVRRLFRSVPRSRSGPWHFIKDSGRCCGALPTTQKGVSLKVSDPAKASPTAAMSKRRREHECRVEIELKLYTQNTHTCHNPVETPSLTIVDTICSVSKGLIAPKWSFLPMVRSPQKMKSTAIATAKCDAQMIPNTHTPAN
jgi:hypothetical protein